jgi:NADP-dependent 3-hydroxy acid dehydrogenase YdfG
MKKYALITGGGSGIGLEFAKILFAQYNLVLVGRDKDKLEKAKEYLQRQSIKHFDIITINLDLSKSNSALNLFKECEKKSLDIYILINNAGYGAFGEHIVLDDDKIINMLNLNITTLTLLCKYFGFVMKTKRSGYILNVASLAAYQPVPYISAYAASKSYVLNFSEALSKEIEDYVVNGEWVGVFGGTSIIDLSVVEMLEEKYKISNLVNFIRTRKQRQLVERVLGILLCYEKNVTSNFGDIHKYPKNFESNNLQTSIHNISQANYNTAIIKLWRGR